MTNTFLSEQPTRPLTKTDNNGALSNEWSSLTNELIDTLPRVWSRGLLYILVTFTVTVLPWALLSEVDETGTARGRLEPEDRVVKLDTVATGTVSSIEVQEGQPVQAGQVLVKLDSDLLHSDLQEAQARLEGLLERVSQLELMRNQLEISIRAQRLQNQAQQSAQLAQLQQSQQRLNDSKTARNLASDRVSRDQLEVQRYQRLLQAGVVPETQVTEVRRLLDESQHVLNQAQAEIRQAEHEIAEQQSNYENVVRMGELNILEGEQRIQQIQTQISDTQAEIAQTKEQIQSLQLQLRQRVLRTSEDGIVFQLAVKTPGEVLQAGQEVAQIAPKEADPIFRAQMPSQESGFLREGMPVKLKFDAYPFQDYGVIPGRLTWISPDSRVVESEQGTVEVFDLEIALDQTYISSQEGREPLKPGQTATAEVVVRQRRVIDYILDPFKRLRASGMEL